MECVSPISLCPFRGYCPKTVRPKREDVRTVSRTLWLAHNVARLSTVFLKGNTLGAFACLQISLNRRVYELFIVAKNRANICVIFLRARNDETFQTKGSRTPLLLCFDCLCSSKSFVRGAIYAEGPSSEAPDSLIADPQSCRPRQARIDLFCRHEYLFCPRTLWLHPVATHTYYPLLCQRQLKIPTSRLPTP